MNIIWRCFFIFMFARCPFCAYAQILFLLKDAQDRYVLGNFLEYLEDPTDDWTIADVVSSAHTERQAQEGTGLGLTISRKFVQLMGGDLRVRSEIGVGSPFSFHITGKRMEQAASVRRRSSTLMRPVSLEPGQPRYRILIADDSLDNRKLLVTLLAPFDFEIREAANGQEAIDVWRDWQPHLIWMDLRMPVLDGNQATRQIKATPQSKQTKVIVLSASVIDDDRLAVMAAGCDDFLGKPFREAEVFALLEQHLGLRCVYAEKQPEQVIPEEVMTPDALTAAIAALPPDFSAAFLQATRQCNLTLMLHLIAQLRPEHKAVVDTLTKLAENFEYKRLLTLFEDV
ncbi:two-component system sensor histidine kinase/response regulator [Candidatus Vecturithrix granuli]|uniref:histidine kinase n=1 Tax=Vecturithrix granuli TaxID=1499967 RepID=A0A0S6WA39_VECG1|nr:two-component system sensor histidine kinase/response regulator [Candidatus Vecturithrix granuli]